MTSRLWTPPVVFSLALFLRLGMLGWGHYQDTHSPVKYTDIDYLVFTDAARFVSRGQSPYLRDTYRYTPLLAWLLYPTAYAGLFDFGKWLFALGDIVAGALIYSTLRSGQYGFSIERASKYAAVWVLNPMVATISTRGSSEGLLAVIVVAILWAALRQKWIITGVMLGLAVHFKIYPFIYGASLLAWLFHQQRGKPGTRLYGLYSKERVSMTLSALFVFTILNVIMYNRYGGEFLEHSYLYHLKRIDHRHNFSVWNTQLHLQSALGGSSNLRMEDLAFYPQILLSCLVIPFSLGGRDLAGTMLAQTFAFVTFNKVCTSQYFLWYMVFLPFYLPESSFMKNARLGLTSLVAWVLGQAAWLQQGYQLEFLGNPTFAPQLWLATVVFFGINCGLLGVIISDIACSRSSGDKLSSLRKRS